MHRPTKWKFVTSFSPPPRAPLQPPTLVQAVWSPKVRATCRLWRQFCNAYLHSVNLFTGKSDLM